MKSIPFSSPENYTADSSHVVVRLRPHHLLCLQNFRGNGYSADFVRKMTQVSRLLQSPSRQEESSAIPSSKAPRAAICLTKGSDDLCESCPNCIDGRCSSEKPARFDSLVLETSGFSYGQLLPDGMKTAGVPAMSRELLMTCCPDCQWLSLCLEICSAF